jgi:transcriptional regulator with XRE-family HTH domain
MDLKTFGQYLRDVREDRGWTLDEAAPRMGTNRATLSRWERGEQSVRWSEIPAIAQAFETTPEQFLSSYLQTEQSSGTFRIPSLLNIRLQQAWNLSMDQPEPERQMFAVLQAVFLQAVAPATTQTLCTQLREVAGLST